MARSESGDGADALMMMIRSSLPHVVYVAKSSFGLREHIGA